MGSVKDRIEAQMKAKGAQIDPASKFEMLGDPEMLAKFYLKRRLDAVVKFAEAKRKELAADIEIALIGEGVEAVTWDGCVVKQGKGRAGDKIIATKLVELGVSVDIIAAATLPGEPYTFAQIVVPKDQAQPITTWAELEANMPEDWEG